MSTDPRGDAAWTDPAEPPHWGQGPNPLEGTDKVWYTWLELEWDGGRGYGDPHMWHWCANANHPPPETFVRPGIQRMPGWVLAGTGQHTIVQEEPLTITPSLLWHCCNTHGFITNGVWRDA